jgi:hypothetical protein
VASNIRTGGHKGRTCIDATHSMFFSNSMDLLSVGWVGSTTASTLREATTSAASFSSKATSWLVIHLPNLKEQLD